MHQKLSSKASEELSKSRTLKTPLLMRGRIGKVPIHRSGKRYEDRNIVRTVCNKQLRTACSHWLFQIWSWFSNSWFTRRYRTTGWESHERNQRKVGKIKNWIERRVNTRRLIVRKPWFHFQWKFTAHNLRNGQRGIVLIEKNYGDRSMPILLQTCLGRKDFQRMRILLTSWWGHYWQSQSKIQDLDCTQ